MGKTSDTTGYAERHKAKTEAKVLSIRPLTEDVREFVIASDGSAPLPDFTSGSHIDIALPNGLVRQYSIIRRRSDPPAYVIAVKREPASRGGSSYMFDQLGSGQKVTISAPRNNFPLDESAAHSVLIAGGIGITPILAMAERLAALGLSFETHYASRSRAAAAYVADLEKLGFANLHFDDEMDGEFLDIEAIVSSGPPGTHYYCCGPQPMLSGFEAATADIDPKHVHLEYFVPKNDLEQTGRFSVQIGRDGPEYEVSDGETILQVLRREGYELPSSCEQGICASCEVYVLEGEPDHHDSVLTDAERNANETMMICCSRSRSPKLVLEIPEE